MLHRHRLQDIGSHLFVMLLLSALPCLPPLAVTPGVDIAEPKVSNVILSEFIFMPGQTVIERGDYVFWKNMGSITHTSTSGAPCVANGIWNISLPVNASMMRQFLETPGSFPYFCTPHCGLNMIGNVTVTTPIVVQASDSLGTLTLSWSGGGGIYKVFRSSTPGFVGAPAAPPAGGDAGTSFSDAAVVSVGQINFYLVLNK